MNVDVEKLTPMMRQYLDTKNEYQDCILFYRLGDFYEMFFDDAITVSKELELTLTGKSCGLPERAPMCGVPYHAADTYLTRLVSKGYKVAVCEQVEDPKLAKGLVKREVVRIVTPGTNLDTQALDEKKNNYILCIFPEDGCFGLAACDVTTGDFFVTELDSNRNFIDELGRYQPSEIVTSASFLMCGLDVEDIRTRMCPAMYTLDWEYFDEERARQELLGHFSAKNMEGLGLQGYHVGITAAGALLRYLEDLQKTSLSQLRTIKPYSARRFMILDAAARRNLELVETIREKKRRGSLLWVLDKTKTAMGARTLRSYIEQPLIEKQEIERRLDAVEELKNNLIVREELREYLNAIYDMERLISRVVYQTANPRDLIAFRNSARMLPPIKLLLEDFSSGLLAELQADLDPLEDICALIEESIVEEPPVSVREGGMIREGYHPEIDRLRLASTDGKSWLAKIEEEERKKTGIKNLRIKYNKVFGYYLEVTNSYKDLVPDYYTRKQTLTNAERYITPELKELEETILGAEDRLVALEYDLFCDIRNRVANEVERIQRSAKAIAALDVFAGLAAAADQNGYCRPAINGKGILDVKNGRHPVVEQMMNQDLFIGNDLYLDSRDHRISIITGPNMAGKSTYMRQNALIVLMAQIGSFVPADAANIGICDRIFTRVGASDDLAGGQSTFMVEMSEVANILQNATSDSLLILDEIGRGTSTIDGLSIAWAVVEHISNPKLLGAKTLFATHYHELTELEGKLKNVHNYCIAVRERGDDIVFLRKIIPGGADKSYGIQVARLAGVPDVVIGRAKEICARLEESNLRNVTRNLAGQDSADPESGREGRAEESGTRGSVQGNPAPEAMRAAGALPAGRQNGTAGAASGSLQSQPAGVQLSLFDPLSGEEKTVISELKQLDLGNMTPFAALGKLYELQEKLKTV